SMTKDVWKYQDEMGETGAGIILEEEIDVDADDPFTRSWDTSIKERCLWYWHLKAIISEHPSIIPAGLGNNSSGYDLLILDTSFASDFDPSDGQGYDIDLDNETQSGMADEFEPEDEGDNDLAEGNSDGDKEEERGKDQLARTSKVSTTKQKVVPVEEKKPGVDGKNTAACNRKSAPMTQPAAKKIKTGISKLEAITIKEEETTQKVLDLKKTKAQGVTERELAKICARTQQYKLKAELASKKLDMEAKKMEHEFQLCMAQLGHCQPGPSNFEISHKTGAPSSGWSSTFMLGLTICT
ncbi:hypothetical protein L208DRAFT_1234094, partial [Tricholoma matsutake]